MTEIHIGLPWWPPSPDAPIGAQQNRPLPRRPLPFSVSTLNVMLSKATYPRPVGPDH